MQAGRLVAVLIAGLVGTGCLDFNRAYQSYCADGHCDPPPPEQDGGGAFDGGGGGLGGGGGGPPDGGSSGGPNLRTCSLAGGTCATPSACCSSLCTAGFCQCKSLGAPCENAFDCCTGLGCDITSHTCQAPLNGLGEFEEGWACYANDQCYGDLCQNGVCSNPTSCRGVESLCYASSGSCCAVSSLVCTPPNPVSRFCLVPAGGACTRSSACVSQNCDSERQCASTCRTAGSACTEAVSCCSGVCNGSGTCDP